jgi:hypothetical protein
MSNTSQMLDQLHNPDTKARILKQSATDQNIIGKLADPNTRQELDALAVADWATATSYDAGAVILPLTGNSGGYYFQTSAGGTSGGSEPSPWNQTVGGTSSDGDGGVTWTNLGQVLPYWL